jgi:pimeloyl-ACP methyl ester carboxylesterase
LNDRTRAEVWRERGAYFSWTPDASAVAPVEVFHVEGGNPAAPVLLLVHGFPTSSIDWFGVFERLSARFRVCALDFPGYGFSQKPRAWGYSLGRDAELLRFYLSEIIGTESATVVAHDRGDSVALIFAVECLRSETSMRVEHLFLTNGNIFLPLSNLTSLQLLLLDETTAPDALRQLTPERLAHGMGEATFTPARAAGDPDVDALVATFAHDDGIAVLHETIQYLRERAANETAWLDTLASSTIPTTLIWGLNDTVSPPRVPMFVWNQYLMRKPGRNSLYFIPDANHYVQNDRPDAFADAVLHALDMKPDTAPGAIDVASRAPVLVDCSRERLPAAVEVLAPGR